MNVRVKYLAQARPAAGMAQETGGTARARHPIADLLACACRRSTGALRHLLLTADGQPHPSLLLFMDDRQVHNAASQKLCDADEILVLPPMAGG